jgi:hypothetical protein
VKLVLCGVKTWAKESENIRVGFLGIVLKYFYCQFLQLSMKKTISNS